MGNHYLVKAESGELLHIYYMKGNGICVHRMGSAQNAEILLKDGFYDFDCIFREKGEIHIVCQNSEGSIHHILYKDGEWKRKELLTGKLKLPYPKHFKILPVGERLMFFYIIRHDGNLLLVSQWIGEEEIPSVVGYTSDENQKFLTFIEDGKPSVFYVTPEGVMEKKMLTERHWKSMGIPFEHRRESPLAICKDNRGSEHLLTSRKENGKTEFLHRIGNKKIWGEPISFFQSEEVPADTAFIMEDNRPGFVFFGRSEIRVFTFGNRLWEESPVKERLMHRLRRPTKIHLLSDAREESVGAFQNGKAELIFHRPFLLKKEESGGIIADKRDLSEKVSELEQHLKKLESKIASFEERYERK